MDCGYILAGLFRTLVIIVMNYGCSAGAGKFNELVYNYPIRIPERFSLVIRSLLTQEGICFTLQRDFKFLEVKGQIFFFFPWYFLLECRYFIEKSIQPRITI